MKRARLTAAVAITALAGGAGMASAQTLSLGDIYAKGFGGATWPSNFETTLKEDGEQIARPSFDYETGYTLGVAVGRPSRRISRWRSNTPSQRRCRHHGP